MSPAPWADAIRNDQLDVVQRQHHLNQIGEKHYHADRERMPECDRNQRSHHGARAVLLHSKSDREQPAHAGVDAVIGAQQK
jgi:hypothetical protein